MNRIDFIKTCGLSCIGAFTLGSVLQSCASVKMVDGIIVGENIHVNLSEFKKIKNDKITYRKYIVVHNSKLQFPITVYRINENEYSALWMKCSHQGNQVTAYGDKLQCSAHGSEFDKYGNATHGPAENNLRQFPVSKENELLKISIQAV